MSASRCARRLASRTVVVLSILCALPAWAAASAGDLDHSWGGTGYATTSFPGVYSFANGVVNDDGVVAVGGVQSVTGDFAIAAYRQNGSLAQSFGNGGKVTTDFNGGTDLATAAAFQGDKLVVVGYTSPDQIAYSFAVARYNKDGSLDQSFGNSGKVVTSFGGGEDFADAVAVKDGKIVVAGTSLAGGGGRNFALARYNKDGSLDQSFGSGGKVVTDFNGGTDSANGVVFMGDRILAGGYAQMSSYDFALARYKKDGSLDTSFGNGGKLTTDFGHGDDFAHAVDVNENRIVAVGSASNGANQDFAAAEYDRQGALVSSFGNGGRTTLDMGGDDEAFGGAFQDDGKVVAAGTTPVQFGNKFAVARFKRNGAPDPSFGPGTGYVTTQIGAESGAFALGLGPDQKILAAGYSDNDFAVARYIGDGQDHGGGNQQGSGGGHQGDGGQGHDGGQGG